MDNKKYPTSVNGRQCIGPCYDKDTWIVHPLTLEQTKNIDYPFCPINKTVEKKDGKTKEMYIDECYMPTESGTYSQRELEMNILLPSIDFSCDNFLKIYYNIYTLDELFVWLNSNKNKPLRTRERIVECSWSSYWKSMDTLDNRFIDFYIEMIKQKWIKYVYPIIDKNIVVKGDKVYVGHGDEGNRSDKAKIKKINYFIKNYITPNNIHSLLEDYLQNNKDNYTDIKNHNEKIRDSFVKFAERLF